MTATLADLEHGVADIKTRMARLGRHSDTLWVGYTSFGFGEDPQMQQMRRHAGDGVDHATVHTATEAIAAIRRYQDAGVTFLSAGLPWQTAGELKERLRWFAREVMPAFA